MRTSTLVSLAVPIATFVAASCTFIDVGFDGAGGASSVSSSASSVGGSTAMSTSVSTVSVTEAAATSGMAGTSGVSTSAGMTCDDCLHSEVCDCDHDTVDRFDPDHGCMGPTGAEEGADCNDCNDVVFPGQANWYTVGIDGTEDFDYNCSGTISFQYYTVGCQNGALGLGCAADTMNTSADLHCGGQVAQQACTTSCGLLGLQCCPLGNPETIEAGNGCH